MLQKIKSSLSQGNHIHIFLFVSYSLVLFLKCILFHWDAFHSILISSLWKAPLSFYKFYMAKLLMPLFISSFVFISKTRWWTIIVSFLIDIWCIANLIYFKTYDAFLSVNDILLVSNMDGAWSSITAYFDWYMAVMTLLTILWGSACLLFSAITIQRRWKFFSVSLLITILLAFLNNYFTYDLRFWSEKSKDDAILLENETNDWITFVNAHGGHEWRYGSWFCYIPFVSMYGVATDGTAIKADFMEQYIRQQSIISDFIAINIYYIFHKDFTGERIPLADEDVGMIQPFIKNNDSTSYFPQNNLIVILVESLEDWPLHNDVEEQEIAPSLKGLSNRENVLYCSKIKCQTLGGNSADGQMIVNSGLLPIQNGVACMHYGNNVYPNIAHFFPNSILINPWPKIWNQDTMCIRYSYTQKIEPESGQWEDEQVLATAIDYLEKTEGPMCLFAITVSTHAPFNRVRNDNVQTHAPAILDRYMKCLNYTDSCIGAFMDHVLNDPVLSQSTVIITSDHTIFKSSMLKDFTDYAREQNLSIASGENYCPLIIYSPQLQGNIQITDICYQMDIYPTILHLIGCEDYYWKGFGVNLLDSVARNNRPILEQEAFILSDKIIRANWFETLHNNVAR